MATLYPESMLEDLVAAYVGDQVEVAGELAAILSAGPVLKGFSALEFAVPALTVGCGGSSDDPATGNFHCSLALNVYSHSKEAGIRDKHTAREAELRDINRNDDIEAGLNAKAVALGIPLRVQFFDPKELTRSAVDGNFVSTLSADVEVYFE